MGSNPLMTTLYLQSYMAFPLMLIKILISFISSVRKINNQLKKKTADPADNLNIYIILQNCSSYREKYIYYSILCLMVVVFHVFHACNYLDKLLKKDLL